MKVLIAGIDGYLGWFFASYLALRDHEIAGIDNFYRRKWVKEMQSYSIIPIPSMKERLLTFQKYYKKKIEFWNLDLRNYSQVRSVLKKFVPDVIIHFGECPSAPYSMIDIHHANFVQNNNITTTFNLLFSIKEICPSAHLIKLGTMGEYGTPNTDIPEGFFEIEYNGRKDKFPFPRQASSWYHWSKVHTSNNIMFASKIWNIRATDVMQGVVFGTRINGTYDNKKLLSRFDIDQSFGTVINRFCAQAVINHPLTVYGSGLQKKGILPTDDSMYCLGLALENPPEKGEYRVFNQFQNTYQILDLAKKIQSIAKKFDINVIINHFENPRKEKENHYYNPELRKLKRLGYKPNYKIDNYLEIMLSDLIKYRSRIKNKEKILIPDIRWVGPRRKPRMLKEIY